MDEPTRIDERAHATRRKLPAALSSTGVPFWMTVLMFLAGAVGTYYLAPRVNAYFEAQKLRTEFVIANLSELRSETKSLIAALALFNLHLQNRENVSALHDEALAVISRLQGQAISLYFMLSDEKSQKVMVEFQLGLIDLMAALKSALDKNAEKDTATEIVAAESLKANDRFIRATVNLFAAIGELGGLRSAPPEPGK
jgi:hypothetical protein